MHRSSDTQNSSRVQGFQSENERTDPAPVDDSPYGRPPLTPEQTRNGYARMFGVDPSTLRSDRLEIRDDAFGGRPPLTAEQTREGYRQFLEGRPSAPERVGSSGDENGFGGSGSQAGFYAREIAQSNQGVEQNGGGQTSPQPAQPVKPKGMEKVWQPNPPVSTEQTHKKDLVPAPHPDYVEPSPQQVETLKKISEETGVPLWWLKYKSWAESNHGNYRSTNWDVTNGKKPYGWFQVQPDTAADKDVNVSREELQSYEGSARAAARYYNKLLKEFGGDPCLATSGYNRGPNNVKKGTKWPEETLRHVQKVMPGQCDPYVDYYGNPKNF